MGRRTEKYDQIKNKGTTEERKQKTVTAGKRREGKGHIQRLNTQI